MEEVKHKKVLVCVLVLSLIISIGCFSLTYIGFNYDKFFPPTEQPNNINPTPSPTPTRTRHFLKKP